MTSTETHQTPPGRTALTLSAGSNNQLKQNALLALPYAMIGSVWIWTTVDYFRIVRLVAQYEQSEGRTVTRYIGGTRSPLQATLHDKVVDLSRFLLPGGITVSIVLLACWLAWLLYARYRQNVSVRHTLLPLAIAFLMIAEIVTFARPLYLAAELID